MQIVVRYQHEKCSPTAVQTLVTAAYFYIQTWQYSPARV